MDRLQEIEPRRPADYSATLSQFGEVRLQVWRRRGYCIVKITEDVFGELDSRREERPAPGRGLSPAELIDLYESWGREVLGAMQTSRPHRLWRPAVAVTA